MVLIWLFCALLVYVAMHSALIESWATIDVIETFPYIYWPVALLLVGYLAWWR